MHDFKQRADEINARILSTAAFTRVRSETRYGPGFCAVIDLSRKFGKTD